MCHRGILIVSVLLGLAISTRARSGGPGPVGGLLERGKAFQGGERIALGEADDYKPCIAQLPSGELLLTAFHQHQRDGNQVMEQTLLFRSKDGGTTWSKPEPLDLLGREPYLSVLKDGTLFITGHLLANDVRNKHGYTHGYLHRSTDAGKTWESIRIESEGIKPKASNHSTRNVLQLADGTLLLGVDYDGGGGPFLMWRSRDNGKTWDRTGKCQPKDFKSQYGFFGGETWLWQAKSGKIWALVRVDSNELPIKGRPIKAGNDQADHFILFSSKDEGKTFDRIRDFGDYGEMYMSILRLKDERLLLTFTVRDLKPPLGVRAIAGVETKDGFAFDFAKDRVMLDTRTPIGKSQGGGFGPTVQLKDGTLVTSYSYRGKDDKTHLEVVRWKLPNGQPKEKPATFQVVPGVRQLFLDDLGVEKIENLTRNMHQPKKKGAVIKPDRPWESALQTRCAPAWDEQAKCFKLWLLTSTPVEGVAGTTYVESRDGVQWTKPILRQWAFKGSLENNFVALDPNSSWPANAMENVVYDPDDADPQRRFKGFLGAFGRAPIVSPDGIRWKRLEVRRLPSADESNLSYDRPSRRFIATLKTNGPFGRSHALWTSPDFKKWTDSGVLLHADQEDQRRAKENIRARLADTRLQAPRYQNPADYNADIYNVGIFRYESHYVGLPAVYHATGKLPTVNTDGFHLIQLISSRDLRTWRRLGDRRPFLGPSPVGEGAYDLTQLLPPSAPVIRDNELWFYYTGLKYRAEPLEPQPGGRGAICLAVLRRDGFVSLDAGDRTGTLLTKPFVLPAGRLHVNADTAKGVLQVTVCDEKGQPIKGFEQSRDIRTDKTAVAVAWGGANLERLRGRNVRLRFTMQKGKLFSYWSGEQE